MLIPHQTPSLNHRIANPPTMTPRINNTANPSTKDRPLPNFHMSNSELFRRLCGQSLLTPCPGKTFTAPYPRWYDANLSCEYHSNTPGHSIGNCHGFKHVVWRLIDTKAIQLEETEVAALENVETVNALRNAMEASLLIHPSYRAEELDNWESEPLNDLLCFE